MREISGDRNRQFRRRCARDRDAQTCEAEGRSASDRAVIAIVREDQAVEQVRRDRIRVANGSALIEEIESPV